MVAQVKHHFFAESIGALLLGAISKAWLESVLTASSLLVRQ